jgi:hypothetical protein
MTRTAKILMDVLLDRGSLYTPELRASGHLKGPEQTLEFERAMGELQRGLWIVKTEERYEPSFSYRWDLLDQWLGEQIKPARKLDRAEAVYHLVRKHLEAVHYSRADLIASLLNLPISGVTVALDRLISEGRSITHQLVRGLPGRWIMGITR